ncbi:MAG: bifunctional YncE family protein/alkaline phosphatase family protein [Chitinophagaceae bacterium]
MKNRLIFPIIVAITTGCFRNAPAQTSVLDLEKSLNKKRIELPNGWSLSPAGTSISLQEDLPLNMALSASGKYLAITNNGDGKQSVTLVDTKTEKILDDIPISESWLGLAFGQQDQYLYVSGGNDNIILRFLVWKGRLVKPDTLRLGAPWPNRISPAGLAVDDAHHLLFVVTKEDSALYVVNLRTQKVWKRIPLPAEAYSCALSPRFPVLYISLWGGARVLVVNTQSLKITAEIPVGSHPNDLVVSKNGKFVFVANANTNSVSIIDAIHNQDIENISATLYPDAPIGSTTNSVALSEDQKRLYIANADNNCLAVFDVSHPGQSHSLGFIPVGWYPTCVRMVHGKLWVSNGKGFSSMANPHGPNPLRPEQLVVHQSSAGSPPIAEQYIGSLFKGSLSIIADPDSRSLGVYSQAVYRNTPYSTKKQTEAPGRSGNPIPRKMGGSSPIKYIFYILKENRTYDQVLGDMKEGNGDSSLCIFGDQVTPNEHALSRDFVLLDHFFVDAEVSADGHNWSMAAYATDFVEKTWPTNYSGRGGNYDFDGSRKIANPDQGFIWENCQREGVSMRNYGEFVNRGVPTLPVLKKVSCLAYPGWDLGILDTYREKIWERDFDSLVAANALPHFNSIYLPDDHTSGLARGAYSPIALVADNDEALGRIIDHLSHSPIWKKSAVFVLEDDAQNGPDHVDAHRSTAFVISPYVKRHSVNHEMYSTSGMLRTLELILGLPPMSQYDAAATPMWKCFTATPDFTPYHYIQPRVNTHQRNLAWNKSMKLSATFDLSRADAVPDRELNAVIWKSVKGENSIPPPPTRSAFVRCTPNEKDGDH